MALILVFVTMFSVVAAPFDSGVALLRMKFQRDVGPKKGGYAIDYSYYSPVAEGERNQKLYPLIIIMAGYGEGKYKGAELQENEFAMWACDEYQEKFLYSGGAYVLMARSPEENLMTWNVSSLTDGLKAMIDDFCVKHPNVDTNRIYAMGWCLGAKGVVNLVKKYPGTLSAAVLMVQSFKLSDSEAQALNDVDVWLIGSKYDSFALYNQYIAPSWEALKKYSDTATGARYFTTYSKAVNTTYFISHNVWLDASYDWNDYSNPSSFAKTTVDSDGNDVSINSFITFLSASGTAVNNELQYGIENNEGCVCYCHKTGFLNKMIWKIVYFFNLAVGNYKFVKCECGQSHVKSNTAPIEWETE